MASLVSPQIQVFVDSVRDTCRHEQQTQGEQRPLLGTDNRWHHRTQYLKRCCIKSKSALLILCWETLFTLTFGYGVEFASIFATDFADRQHTKQYLMPFSYMSLFSILAILYLFYPLAGCLADIRCGRYKTVTYSLWMMLWSGVFVCIGSIIVFLYYSYDSTLPPKKASTILFAIGFGPPTIIGAIVLLPSSIAFSANVIQFGMDQLHDSPAEDSVFFIHWFVFASHLGAAINKFIILNVLRLILTKVLSIVTQYTTPALALTLLGISLGIAHYKHQWFMIDSGSRNPYKLVYKVIKFAAQHKSPIRRSAFTYCEDELPSRMDLAKEKYGGPFTTEQVEDVKAFLGILIILLTFGSMFITDVAVSNVLFKFSLHLEQSGKHNIHNRWYTSVPFEYFLIGGLPEILTIVVIPIYLGILRPFVHRYIPGMLKRIGLGMIMCLLSLLSVLLIDTVGHMFYSTNNMCFVHQYSFESLNLSVWYVAIPYTLNALSDMLFYIAAYEFICAQSPQAMKGLLIGTFFTIKGVFQLTSVSVILIPFTVWKFETSFPSCGFVYYLVNIVVAVIGLVAYTWVSRRYQYRQRDEPDNIYRYAEEYYDRD